MRRILVDCARSRKCRKRGGGAPQLTFDENLAPDERVETDLVALDDALEALSGDGFHQQIPPGLFG
ncbi:MAG: hypothetical protein KIT09_23190 [Bryobacteraceae bacterium]|nr:hypothetical protein [Bryobacteraceae bacterium]